MRGSGSSVVIAGAVLALAACSDRPASTFQGYAEGEYVQVASPYSGSVQKLAVARGNQVDAGATLFVLEHGVEQAAVDAAEARVRTAEARIANLAVGRRKPELDVIRAQAESAAAALKLARIQLAQQEKLFVSGFVSKERLDEARANCDRGTAALEEMQAQYRAGVQSLGRTPEIDAARADLEAARADLAQTKVKLEHKTGIAPAAALVQDTFYREGEWAAGGSPVLSLLPPTNIKARFFVPEPVVGTLRMGQAVSLACDGCGAPIAAKITYISPQAEYTPPVIYSRDSRAKLVFMIEARPALADATRLHPGQPLDVSLQAP
ncbi:MAG: HlyD family efflux transporter periplasmic adaptor subunit [Burkholderiales bacterium]